MQKQSKKIEGDHEEEGREEERMTELVSVPYSNIMSPNNNVCKLLTQIDNPSYLGTNPPITIERAESGKASLSLDSMFSSTVSSEFSEFKSSAFRRVDRKSENGN